MSVQQGQPQEKKSNKWIWVIVGLAILVPVSLVIAIVAGVFGFLFFGTKSVAEYSCAIEQVKKNEKAIELLGTPMEEGSYIVPNIQIRNGRREVNFSTSLAGPKAEGTLLVNSYRDAFRSDFLMKLRFEGKPIEIYRGRYPCEDN